MTSSVVDCGYCRQVFASEEQAAGHREDFHRMTGPPEVPLCIDCYREPRLPPFLVGRACHDRREQRNRQQQQLQWAEIAGQQHRMRDWSLETFPADDRDGRAALAAVEPWLWTHVHQRFLDGKLVPINDAQPEPDIDRDDHPIWGWYHDEHVGLGAYIWGGVGSGKTGLAWALLRARVQLQYDYEERREAWPAWANVVELLDRAKAAMRDGDGGEPVRALYNSSVLVLDDLGAERPTDWALDAVAALVQHRHTRDLPTIVTSNYSPSQLVQRLGNKDAMVGRRIVSRLTENCLKVKLDRADLRQRRAAA